MATRRIRAVHAGRSPSTSTRWAARRSRTPSPRPRASGRPRHDRQRRDRLHDGGTGGAATSPPSLPAAGLPGTVIGIDGARLGQATTVIFGDVAAAFTIDASGHITAVAPAGRRRRGRRAGRQRHRPQRRLALGPLHVHRLAGGRPAGRGRAVAERKLICGRVPTCGATRCAARAGSSRATTAASGCASPAARGARPRTCGASRSGPEPRSTPATGSSFSCAELPAQEHEREAHRAAPARRGDPVARPGDPRAQIVGLRRVGMRRPGSARRWRSASTRSGPSPPRSRPRTCTARQPVALARARRARRSRGSSSRVAPPSAARYSSVGSRAQKPSPSSTWPPGRVSCGHAVEGLVEAAERVRSSPTHALSAKLALDACPASRGARTRSCGPGRARRGAPAGLLDLRRGEVDAEAAAARALGQADEQLARGRSRCRAHGRRGRAPAKARTSSTTAGSSGSWNGRSPWVMALSRSRGVLIASGSARTRP